MPRLGLERMNISGPGESDQLACLDTRERYGLIDGQHLRFPAARRAYAECTLAAREPEDEFLVGFRRDQNFLCTRHFLIYNLREPKTHDRRSNALSRQDGSLSFPNGDHLSRDAKSES